MPECENPTINPQPQITLHLLQAVSYDNDRKLTCLSKIAPATTYESATSQCVSLGGYLISAQTSDRLALLAKLTSGKDVWVGIDDREKSGSYIWQNDGSLLTTAQINEVFTPSDPDNSYVNEDCGIFWTFNEMLGDTDCYYEQEGFCEVPAQEAFCY